MRRRLLYIFLIMIFACVAMVMKIGFVRVGLESIPPRDANPIYFNVSVVNAGLFGLMVSMESGQALRVIVLSPKTMLALGEEIKSIPATAFKQQYGKHLASYDAGQTYILTIDGKKVCCQISEFPDSVAHVASTLAAVAINHFPTP